MRRRRQLFVPPRLCWYTCRIVAVKLATSFPISGNWDGVVYGTVIAVSLGCKAVAALMFFVTYAQFIPESARFNVSTGNTPAALATLERIAKMNHSVMPEGKLVEPILVSSSPIRSHQKSP